MKPVSCHKIFEFIKFSALLGINFTFSSNFSNIFCAYFSKNFTTCLHSSSYMYVCSYKNITYLLGLLNKSLIIFLVNFFLIV